MWKPADVVPEHRWRARIVWAGLLSSITAFTTWQVWNIFERLKNPNTSLHITDEVYDLPYLMACFLEDSACNWSHGETDVCVESALNYTYVYFNGTEQTDIIEEMEASNCVGFDLRKLVIEDAETDTTYISMEWFDSDMASNITFTSAIGIYISEEPPPIGTYRFLGVPYSSNLVNAEEVVWHWNYLKIGKTTKENLAGEVTTTFPALTMSTADVITNETYSPEEGDYAIGRMILEIDQGIFSHTIIKEVSPLDVGNFLGNVGGFWELLVILWGVFFIAAGNQREPKLKPRNFRKAIKKGFRRRSLAVDSASLASRVEERPHWESAYGSDKRNSTTTAVADFGPLVVPPVHPVNSGSATRRASITSSGSGSTMVGHRRRTSGSWASQHSSSSSFKRPVMDDMPRRSSRPDGLTAESGEPAHPSYAVMTDK